MGPHPSTYFIVMTFAGNEKDRVVAVVNMPVWEGWERYLAFPLRARGARGLGHGSVRGWMHNFETQKVLRDVDRDV